MFDGFPMEWRRAGAYMYNINYSSIYILWRKEKKKQLTQAHKHNRATVASSYILLRSLAYFPALVN